MNLLLFLVIMAVGLGLAPRLPARWLSPLLFALALIVTGLYFATGRGR